MNKYAHISEDNRKQTILEHVQGTAKLASEFAMDISLQKEAEYVGLMHDIGKYSEEFQHRLYGGPKVDHSTAGAFEAYKNRKLIESFCIAGHHSGLPDGGYPTELEGSSLQARINRAKQGQIPNYSEWVKEIETNKYSSDLPSDLIQLSFLIRMLFSCLVDADYLDTEKFMNGEVDRRVAFEPDVLEKKLDDYISNWFPPKGNLNKLRCEILTSVINSAVSYSRGIYTLTVPTGGGKTVDSLAFAIKHAKKHNMKRIIYVIPYTSIIEQTSDVFRKILGNNSILEHHSNTFYFDDDDSELYSKATENWDMPIIVTTSVQFFESIYKNKPSVERKLHNIANSVIIFDEAQMLPLQYLKPCVRSISELVGRFGVTAVLCTATQPSLNNMLENYLPDIKIRELCPESYYVASDFKRVKYESIGKMSYIDIASRLNKHYQCLCIVNSKNAAKAIYDLMNADGFYHLSTLMYPEHRKRVLTEIRERLQNNCPCRVISTSLIEAGVDVDFPRVYRQICGLDSILQAAGRCNREGKNELSDSIVSIFDLECGSPEIFSKQISAGDYVLNKYKDRIDCKDAIKEYFDNLFYLSGDSELDHYGILDRLKNDNLPFATISERFNIIGNNTRSIYIETEENRVDIEAMKHGYARRENYRRLGLYSVNVYEHQFKKLLEDHSIIILDNGNGILLDDTLYSNETGLDLGRESGQGIFV